MTRLRQRDLTALSNAVETLHEDSRASTLARRILASLRSLFDCDFASFSLMDLRQGRWHTAQISPVVSAWPGAEAYQRCLRDDPAAVHILRTRTRAALKISDFFSLRQYRASRLYDEMFRPVGCDRRLGFAVQGSPVTLAATLNRKGRDFSEDERALLDLLQPHLLQANSHAHSDRLAVAARLRFQNQPAGRFGVGLVELDACLAVRWLTPRADLLLRQFFPRVGRHVSGAGRLPAVLERQVKRLLGERAGRTPEPALVATGDVWSIHRPQGKQLEIRLVRGGLAAESQLLLEEHDGLAVRSLANSLGLTAREGEVLYWVGEGKTNRKISQCLDISENTVGKHLEHVFTKLGVQTRTAALHALRQARAAL